MEKRKNSEISKRIEGLNTYLKGIDRAQLNIKYEVI